MRGSKIEVEETNPEKGMKIVGTYLNAEMYKKLQEEADESFTSVSSIVRKIIYKYLNDQK